MSIGLINGDTITGTNKADPTGWKDIMPTTGFAPKGVAEPAVKPWDGDFRAPAYAHGVTEDMAFGYHLDHEYIQRTGVYYHIHWTNKAQLAGSVHWRAYIRYGRRNGIISDIIERDIIAAVDPAGIVHKIDESLIINESDFIAPVEFVTDGMFFVVLKRMGQLAKDTSLADAFLLEADMHVQTDGTATVERNDDGTATPWTKVLSPIV